MTVIPRYCRHYSQVYKEKSYLAEYYKMVFALPHEHASPLPATQDEKQSLSNCKHTDCTDCLIKKAPHYISVLF